MRDHDLTRLRDAFPAENPACCEALIAAARSVKEDEPVRKTTFRAAVMAAVIMIATVSMALAGSLLGWTDFFAGYGDIIPDSAQRIMTDAGDHTFTLGGVTFTTRELYCDGYIAMASTQITAPDGGLVAAEPWDPIGATGEDGKKAASALGVAPSVTWVEAAQQLGKKLYSVRAILEMPEELMGDGGMEDPMYADTGMTYFSMAYMNGAAKGDAVEAAMFLRVAEIDPATGEEMSKQTARETIRIALEAPIAQTVYTPEAPFAPNGYTLTGVRAVLMPAGLYVYADFTAPEGAAPDAVYDLWGNETPRWLDADGNPIPTGADLSSYLNVENHPAVVFEDMLPLGEMPQRLILQVNDETVEVVR